MRFENAVLFRQVIEIHLRVGTDIGEISTICFEMNRAVDQRKSVGFIDKTGNLKVVISGRLKLNGNIAKGITAFADSQRISIYRHCTIGMRYFPFSIYLGYPAGICFCTAEKEQEKGGS